MLQVPVKKDISAINNRKHVSKVQELAARQRIAELRKKMAAARKENKDKIQVDILLPNKKGLAEHTDIGDVNIVVLNDKTSAKESSEKRKSNHQVSNKKSMPAESNDLSEESSELNSSSKLRSAQKKKLATSNKENVFLDNGSSDLKHTPAKQASKLRYFSYMSKLILI